MRAPGVAVAAAAQTRCLRRRPEAVPHEAAPEVEPREEEVRAVELEVRLEEVVREVDRHRREALRPDKSVERARRPVGGQGVRKERKALRVLREAVLRARVGDKAAHVIPERRDDGPRDGFRLRLPVGPHRRVAAGALGARRLAEGVDVEEVVDRRAATPPVRRDAQPAPRLAPVHEAPARQVFKEAVRVAVRVDLRKRLAETRDPLAEELVRPVPKRIVAELHRPAQRKRRRVLLMDGREVHANHSVGAPRGVEDANPVAQEAVVA